MNACFEENGVPSRIEHFASWFYFGFPSDQPYGSLLYYHLREKGIHIQEGFPCFLTTAHSEADVEAVIRAFRESVAEMREAGFLSGPDRPDDPHAAVAAAERAAARRGASQRSTPHRIANGGLALRPTERRGLVRVQRVVHAGDAAAV